ncbi:RteC domain-containing protein [Flavobacterium faecale]|uniref:RteC domain-containing protein n=1 Tax=Flavobacterium faecale TaxID=1355330 RepID=UPI003AAEF27A
MISFQHAIRDEFLEMSVPLRNQKKDKIKFSKEFIFWAETKIDELHEWLKTHDFENEEEEIEFFKEIKPCIVSKLIFQKELLRIHTNMPSGNKLSLKFFEEELKKAAKSLNVESKFYSYYRSDANDWDSQYFTRKTKKSILDTDNSQIGFDSKISTCYDNKIASILAHDLLICYIENRIRKIKTKIKLKKKASQKAIKAQSNLQWTGTKTEFIELIYALYFAKVLNNGNISIKEIASTMGALFNMDIKDSLYRTYSEIKKRKAPSSIFLQRLVDIFRNKIIEDSF